MKPDMVGLGKLVREVRDNLVKMEGDWRNETNKLIVMIDERLAQLGLPIRIEDAWINLTVNDVGHDPERNEYVIVTNGRCHLPHSVEDYPISHAGGGCEFVPSEGMIGSEKDGVWFWRLENITGRKLVACGDEMSQKVRNAHRAFVDALKKKA